MNVFAKFYEIPSMILQDIKETKRTDTRTNGRTDNVKTVYPPTNTVCGGYNNVYGWKPQFYYIKVGFKGVFITRTCYHDGFAEVILMDNVIFKFSIMIAIFWAHNQ